MKRSFHFKVIYFKPSGKFYVSEFFELEVTDCGLDGHPSVYMQDAVDYLIDLRDTCGGVMPGLSGKWRGHIMIDCEQGFPCLIPAQVCDTE